MADKDDKLLRNLTQFFLLSNSFIAALDDIQDTKLYKTNFRNTKNQVRTLNNVLESFLHKEFLDFYGIADQALVNDHYRIMSEFVDKIMDMDIIDRVYLMKTITGELIESANKRIPKLYYTRDEVKQICINILEKNNPIEYSNSISKPVELIIEKYNKDVKKD